MYQPCHESAICQTELKGMFAEIGDSCQESVQIKARPLIHPFHTCRSRMRPPGV
jgi:hypothetical protein